ncbi:MAG: nucleotide sugar dehydrogenase [Pelagibacterales bacterium]|nr:nucleotide sugar dehydrogenase [Pelagibacterales bacterium]
MKITIVGLGYVGLPLAVAFAKKFSVVGYDINKLRISELNQAIDQTKEVNLQELKSVLIASSDENVNGLYLSSDKKDIKDSEIYIITVPTPITKAKSPDLLPLISASNLVGKFISKGNIVIYESTVYPGCTEEECVPILEKESGLKFNKDFFCGYSPERINPGDKINTLTKIKKVTSGSNTATAIIVDELYNNIIDAGTHLASSIKVAEASKVIENAQRDLNISFVNELALIFDRIGIDTNEVLEAAATKWNFLYYKPGLVGGHCISVDPYYLAYKAESLGYHPAVLLSGRRVNDQMASFVVSKMIKLMINKGCKIKESNILILGVTFKENCPDIRNSKIIDVYKELVSYGLSVDIHDPISDAKEVKLEWEIELVKDISIKNYDGVLFAVAHDVFLTDQYKSLVTEDCVIFDLKNIIKSPFVDGRL